jgi:hypothetical protein
VLVPTETVWRKVPLRWPDAPTSKAEGKALAAMLEYQVADVHFFAAEGTDLTRPMALKGAADASETEAAGMEARAFPGADCEFVWNAQLAEPVTACGAAGMCPALVQGFAESRSFGERTGQRRWHLLLLARRSWLHPGPRFIARGLNARCMPGNEVECEHVLWVASKRDDSGRRAARWASHIWRRGSVPIWWEQRIEKAVGEAEIYVRDNPTRGAGAYFEHIFKRYETLAVAPVESTGAATRTAVTGYTCINLLRCAEGRAEVQLTEYFQQAVREARKAMNAHRSTSVGELGVVAVGGSGDSDGEADNSSVAGASQRAIEVVNFDWHATVKQMGEDGAVEGMWERLQPHVASSGFSMGEVRMPATPGGAPEVTLDRKQCGFLRFNCADSLDRTNLGGFYAGLQTLVAMCKALDLDIAPAKANASNGLPAGWEMRMHEGKPFYIDHNTKTTTWTHPFADEQGAPSGADDGDGAGVDLADGRENLWAVYEDVLLEARKEVSAGTRRFKESVSPQLLSALAEIHVNQGDVHAAVYTGTKAQHSRSMHVLSAERPRGGQRANKAANAAISIQRRIVNMAQDSGRLLQQEAFLGARPMHAPLAACRRLLCRYVRPRLCSLAARRRSRCCWARQRPGSTVACGCALRRTTRPSQSSPSACRGPPQFERSCSRSREVGLTPPRPRLSTLRRATRSTRSRRSPAACVFPARQTARRSGCRLRPARARSDPQRGSATSATTLGSLVAAQARAAGGSTGRLLAALCSYVSVAPRAACRR